MDALNNGSPLSVTGRLETRGDKDDDPKPDEASAEPSEKTEVMKPPRSLLVENVRLFNVYPRGARANGLPKA